MILENARLEEEIGSHYADIKTPERSITKGKGLPEDVKCRSRTSCRACNKWNLLPGVAAKELEFAILRSEGVGSPLLNAVGLVNNNCSETVSELWAAP